MGDAHEQVRREFSFQNAIPGGPWYTFDQERAIAEIVRLRAEAENTRDVVSMFTSPPSPRVRLMDEWWVVATNGFTQKGFTSAEYAKAFAIQWDDGSPNEAPHRVVRVALVDEGVSDPYTSPRVVVTEAMVDAARDVLEKDYGKRVLFSRYTINDALTAALADADAGGVTSLSPAATSVLAERERQRSEEGWTEAHDDARDKGELADAAASYAVTSGAASHMKVEDGVPAIWPWDRSWYKRGDRRRDLVKAGALILAEIERLDRAELPRTPNADAGGVQCAEAFHIAEYIEEEMTARGWDRDELALRMGGTFGVTRLALDLLMDVRTPDVILGEQAEQLGRAFGTSAALWRNLHETWRKHPTTPRTSNADAGGAE